MPTRPPRACAVPRCPHLAAGRYCSAHAQRAATDGRARDRQRGTAHERGYGSKWQEARVGFLAKHRFCECSEHRGLPNAPFATVVDHHIPHKGDKARFWDRSNWRALSTACHNKKTATQDGGFGRKCKVGNEIGPVSRDAKALDSIVGKAPSSPFFV